MSQMSLLYVSMNIVVTCIGITNNLAFIWPLPSTYTISANMDLNIDRAFKIITTSTSSILNNGIKRYQTDIIFPHSADNIPSSTLVNTLLINVKSSNETLQFDINESYELSINIGQSTLNASTVYGALRGLETFSQLIQYNFTVGYYQTSTALISDTPRFAWRGLLIDTGRHYQPIKSIMSILDSMSFAKLNVLHWHIVDSQSFPFNSKIYPNLSKGAFNHYERYSLNDISHIVTYAKARGIRVVPEFDIPGHTRSWCDGYPSICANKICNRPANKMDNNPGGILNPANEFTYELIEGLLNEITSVFIDEYLHIGGDETDTKCWSQTEEIMEWEKLKGFSNRDALLYFNKRALYIVNNKLKRKRKAIQWNEMFHLFRKNITKTETTIQVWKRASQLGDVLAAGFDAIFAPRKIWYLNYLTTTWQIMYNTEPTDYIKHTKDVNTLLGGEGCMWGEFVDISDIEQTIWPRMAAIAERLWSPKYVNSTNDAESRYAYFRCLLNERGIKAAPYNPYNDSLGRSIPYGPGPCYLGLIKHINVSKSRNIMDEHFKDKIILLPSVSVIVEHMEVSNILLVAVVGWIVMCIMCKVYTRRKLKI